MRASPIANMDISLKDQEDVQFPPPHICMPAFIQSGCDRNKKIGIELQVLFLNLYKPEIPE